MLLLVVTACRDPEPADPTVPSSHSAAPTLPPADSAAAPAHTGTAGTSSGVPPRPSPGCARGAVLADGDHTSTVGGTTREWILQNAPGADGGTPVPLVLDFHGTGSNARQQKLLSGVAQVGRDDGYTVVWPDSLGSGVTKAFVLTCRSADLDFVLQLLDDVGRDACIDEARVAVTGLSNGAYFSHLVAAQHPELLAAAAPVSGGLGFTELLCRPTVPVPMAIVHGTADTIVPFSEGEAARDRWFDVNRCVGVETDADGCVVGTGCDAPVRFCAAEGVGHLDIYLRYATTDRIAEHLRTAFE
jgi:polyhydroxybutyrate depolymerase